MGKRSSQNGRCIFETFPCTSTLFWLLEPSHTHVGRIFLVICTNGNIKSLKCKHKKSIFISLGNEYFFANTMLSNFMRYHKYFRLLRGSLRTCAVPKKFKLVARRNQRKNFSSPACSDPNRVSSSHTLSRHFIIIFYQKKQRERAQNFHFIQHKICGRWNFLC